jgi:hypothetical protein
MPYNENNGKAVSGNLYQRFDEGLGINPPRLLYRLKYVAARNCILPAPTVHLSDVGSG